VVHLPYKPNSTNERISLGLWKRFDQLIDFSGCVVEMRGDPEAITAWGGDDIFRVELVIERHRGQTIRRANADYLRLFRRRPGAHDLTSFPLETFTQM